MLAEHVVYSSKQQQNLMDIFVFNIMCFFTSETTKVCLLSSLALQLKTEHSDMSNKIECGSFIPHSTSTWANYLCVICFNVNGSRADLCPGCMWDGSSRTLNIMSSSDDLFIGSTPQAPSPKQVCELFFMFIFSSPLLRWLENLADNRDSPKRCNLKLWG